MYPLTSNDLAQRVRFRKNKPVLEGNMREFSGLMVGLILCAGIGTLQAEPLVLTFGKPLPSDPQKGTLVQFEDATNGVAIETFRALPQDLNPFFGLTLVESHFTQMGVSAGRRVSFFPLTGEPNPPLASRLGYIDFAEDGMVERYKLFVDPRKWMPASRIAKAPAEIRDFMANFFYSSELSPAPLNTIISLEDIVMAPRGLLSPQLTRPVFKLTPEFKNLQRSVVLQVTRSYSEAGHLLSFAATLYAMGVDDHLQIKAVNSLVKLDVSAVSGETATVQTLQISRPCHKHLNALKAIEGRVQ